jgi:hypothetical protein
MKSVHAKFIFRILIITEIMAALIGVSPSLHVQAQSLSSPLFANGDFVWAAGFGGIHEDQGQDIKTDSNGNIYLVGYFSQTVDFDPGPSEYNLTSPIGRDVFISKFDKNGNLLWAKQIIGTDYYDNGTSVAISTEGNVYVLGTFSQTIDCDPGSGVYELTTTSFFDYDYFIVKLDTNGNFLWAGKLGGTDSDLGDHAVIDLDGNGNVYAAGLFQGTADFDPGTGIFNLTSLGNRDIFIVKLSSSGSFIWAKSIGGTGFENFFSLAISRDGNVYSTGFFGNTVDFDPGAGTYNLTAAGGEDAFFSKLDENGNFVWAKQLGSADANIWPSDLATDSSGNLYIAGFFYDTIDFDPNAGTYELTSAGLNDTSISKWDKNGNLLWARNIGGTGNEFSSSIALDVSSYVYVTGYFDETADFDPDDGTSNLFNQGLFDIFVFKLDIDGSFMWAESMGGTNNEKGLAVTLSPDGQVYTAGWFADTVDFDPGEGVFNRTSAGYEDIFISRLDNKIPVFADVPFNHWAYSYIERLYNDKVTGGCKTNPVSYCPSTPVTRAQMAVFILKAEHGMTYTPPDATGTVFSDVPLGHWAGPWIEALAAEGITGGCEEALYCPNTVVTRAQMAVLLLRGIHGNTYTPPAVTGMFGDVPGDYWAAAWIEALANEGITGGCGNGNYCPNTVVSRDQMAVFLVKGFNLP